ncbi:amidohydrolase family protein [Stappia stellulata]|uniref:dihydroorotase n=1 Tax=Stappia stellulata TaxID=71235 RepID=UPI001CD28FE4|nr:amidohydrolase family protein [Stappia stellulata]MCA1242131.1 amidohydrolase family protein [Stappia stellulata]
MTLDLLLHNARLVLPDVGVTPGAVGVKDGRIAAILAPDATLPAAETVDCGGLWLMPGLVDPHVHFGYGSLETDFLTEARSAALGGVTSVLSFHRSADPRDALPGERDLALGQSCIDVGFHLGITHRLHVETLVECAKAFGITSYKLYLQYKGQAGLSKGFTEIDDGLLYHAMLETLKVPGGVLGVHCENVEVIPVLRDPLRRAGRADLAAWDAQSPDFLEAENVHKVGYFADKTGCPVNVVHLSSREALEEARRHRRRSRVPMSVETCPHYLSLTCDAEVGPLAKVNPPVRSQDDVDALWDGVMDGTVTTIGTDHVARKRETKTEIWSATMGLPGVATLLPLLIHEGHHARGVPIERIAALTSANPARLYGLSAKGQIAVGRDADLVVVDPDLERQVDPARLESFADYSPFEGRTLRGWPVMTFLRGRLIARDGSIAEDVRDTPSGRYLARG